MPALNEDMPGLNEVDEDAAAKEEAATKIQSYSRRRLAVLRVKQIRGGGPSTPAASSNPLSKALEAAKQAQDRAHAQANEVRLALFLSSPRSVPASRSPRLTRFPPSPSPLLAHHMCSPLAPLISGGWHRAKLSEEHHQSTERLGSTDRAPGTGGSAAGQCDEEGWRRAHAEGRRRDTQGRRRNAQGRRRNAQGWRRNAQGWRDHSA